MSINLDDMIKKKIKINNIESCQVRLTHKIYNLTHINYLNS